MKQQYWGGYSRHNQIFQVETTAEGDCHERLLVENHAIMMYNPFLDQKS
jgi:vancomycin resistance protein VanW